MNIKQTCQHCGGNRFINTQIQVGDIIQPRDGSAMSHALHSLLWNGNKPCNKGRDLPLPQNEAFKPVRVLSIEGDMLAVVPLHWDDPDIHHKEMFNDDTYPALTHIWKGTYEHYQSICDHAFWIHAPISNPILISRKG